MHVSALNSASPLSQTTGLTPGAPGSSQRAQPSTADKLPFTDVMSRFLGEINGQQVQAEQHVTQLATGETDSINDVVLSVAKADMSFRFLMEIRNRLISSYQEIQRMQV